MKTSVQYCDAPFSGFRDSVIYVACPAFSASGGPELAHQLVHDMRRLGARASMFYPISDTGGRSVVPPDFEVYGNPYVTELIPRPQDVLIVPETLTRWVIKYPQMRRAIWWMSVDNYFTARRVPRHLSPFKVLRRSVTLRLERRRPFLIERDTGLPILHLYQSEYARQFLAASRIPTPSMAPLGDYINPAFLRPVTQPEAPRRDVILFNPSKGMALTQQLIDAAPDLRFEPLAGLTRQQMVARMRSAKVYIDFGNHPGKDRIPREACSLGCCIVTNRRGSAANLVDVPIPEDFKIDDRAGDVHQILTTIRGILSDFDASSARLVSYRQGTAAEPDEFLKQIGVLTGLDCKLGSDTDRLRSI